MDACISGMNPVPQWYLAVEKGRIIAGMGAIENDFHDRKDLTPNVCAVYTEENRRGRGIADALLNFVCADMKTKGISTQISRRSMNATAGRSSAWCRATAKRAKAGCTYTRIDPIYT